LQQIQQQSLAPFESAPLANKAQAADASTNVGSRRTVMNITNKTVLITGANRGIGKALVDEALRRGAKRVDAGMRSPVQRPDRRVTPLTLDVTNDSQIQRAVGAIDTLDVLINNAGIALYHDLSDLDVLEQTLRGQFPRFAQSANERSRKATRRESARPSQKENA
jgi:NAD(P)-dependent dehydrogenase (short-subunit alcohol dehydrogenase family)